MASASAHPVICPRVPNGPCVQNVPCVSNGPYVTNVPNVPIVPCVPTGHVSQMFHVSYMSQMSHVSKKKQSPRQIMMENITAMANINHMGGQSHLLTLITKSIDTTFVSYQPLCCGGRDTPVFVNKNGDPFSYYIFDFLITGIDLVFKCRNPRTERAKYLYSEI